MEPFDSAPITQTWEEHLNAGARGGIDYAMPVGTVLRAPSDCIAEYDYYEDSGYRVVLTRPDGSQTVYCHLSRAIGGPVAVAYRSEVARSGNTGWSTGPHCHAYDIDRWGNRVPPFTTISNLPAPAILRPPVIIAPPDPLPIGKYLMADVNYYAHRTGTDYEYGIFGHALPGGYRLTKDVDTARAWGKLYGTRNYDPKTGQAVRVGAPLEYFADDPKLWSALQGASKALADDYFAAIR